MRLYFYYSIYICVFHECMGSGSWSSSFRGPDLNALCVIERWANHPRSEYYCSHCCFHTVITCTVLHPGTPCLRTKSPSALLKKVSSKHLMLMWMCLFLQWKTLLSHFHCWTYRTHFYRSHSTPEGLWMVHTPGAKQNKWTWVNEEQNMQKGI